MTWAEYSKFVQSLKAPSLDLSGFALGMVSEAGEAGDVIKKMVYHGADYHESRGGFQKEAGDVLFYMSGILWEFNMTMDDVIDGNVKKLQERYPNGFAPGGGIRVGKKR
jgi:NTP pyrophosphatase (non-canonical NTP hydrolase)